MFICFLAVSLFLAVQTSVTTGPGCGKGCIENNKQGQPQILDAETKKKYDSFLQDTVELRKELEEKLSEYRF